MLKPSCSSFSFIKLYFRFQISTLATKLGVRNIAFLGTGLLLINYIGSVLAAIYMPQVNTSSFKPSLMIIISSLTFDYN